MGTDHSALRVAGLGMRDASVFQDPRIEPFVNQSKRHFVSYPSLQKDPEMAMVDRVKELSNVHIQNPAASHRHRLLVDVHPPQKQMFSIQPQTGNP